MTGDVHRTWGYKNKTTGIISGMAGQLQRKEADIGGLIEDSNLNSFEKKNGFENSH